MRRVITTAAAIAGLAGATGAAHAQQQTFFSENFENWAGNYSGTWSANMLVDTRPAFSTYAGRYSNDRLTASIPVSRPSGVDPTHVAYSLRFDFIAIDSWDGDTPPYGGPDTFEVLVNGATVFSYTFTNMGGTQSFPHAPDVGPVQMAYATNYPDSIYRNIVVPFNPGSASTVQIAWQGRNLQGLADESWALDNINASYSTVPGPGAAALLGVAGLTGLRRTTRRPAPRTH